MLKNLRFRSKLIIGFTFIITFIIIVGVFALIQLRKLQETTELIYEHPLVVSNAVRDINIRINGIHGTMTDIVSVGNKRELDSVRDVVDRLDNEVFAAFDIVYSQFLGDFSEVDSTFKAYKDWVIFRNKVIELKLAGKDKEATEITKVVGAKHVWNLLEKTRFMTDFAQNKADEFLAISQKTYKQTYNFLLIIIILVIGLSVLITYIIAGSILEPIHKFISEIKALYQKVDRAPSQKDYFTEEDLFTLTVSELRSAYNQIQDFNVELETINESLEDKVKERTAELEKNQFELKEKNEEYLAINEEYESLNDELNGTNKELILAKELIESSAQKLRDLFNNLDAGIVVHGADTSIIDNNQRASELLGLTDEQMKGKQAVDPYWKFMNENNIPMVLEEYPVNKIISIKSPIKDLILGVIHSKNSKVVWLLVNGFPVFDKQNELIEIVINFVDITERKLAEEKLIQSLKNEKLQADIVRTTPIAIAFGYPDGRLDNCNMAFTELTGYSEKELKEINWNKVLTPLEWNEIEAEELKKLSPENNSIRYKKEYINKNGNIIPVELFVTAKFDDNNNLIHFVGFVTDITERKQAEVDIANQNEEYQSINEELRQTIEELNMAKEKAEESDRLKSAFLTNMSHEIRTPMNGIIGFAKLLQKEDITSEKLHDFTKIIVDSSNQLLRIVNDVLDISRIETGQVTILEDTFSLNEMLANIYGFYKPKTDETHLKLKLIKALSDDDDKIIADEQKLRQILDNLISNALKFTKEGSIEFGYQLKNDKMEFFVKDTGMGIDSRFHTNIFNRFNQVRETNDVLYGGTGLGLTICKGFIDRMNGDIWVESKKGEGAIFYFTLPYVRSLTEKRKQMENLIKENKMGDFTVLVVEDEPVNFLYLEEILKNLKLNYVHVITGGDAIQVIKSDQTIDLVLMDIKLPGMNGYEATKEIKKIREDLPVIAQTAYAMVGDKQKALDAGCDDYISKPIMEEQFIQLLEKYLKKA